MAKEKKRNYKRVFTNPTEKIAAGKAWVLPLTVDDDLAALIVSEKESKEHGFNYNEIINRRIRAGYGLLKIKKTKT